jgi:hypothetical protein
MVEDLRLRRRTVTSTRRRRPASGSRSDRSPADTPDRPAKALPDIRRQKVTRIREALDAGCYDADARLQDMLGELSTRLAAANLYCP